MLEAVGYVVMIKYFVAAHEDMMPFRYVGLHQGCSLQANHSIYSIPIRSFPNHEERERKDVKPLF
jgi:hypothetical protein